MKKVSKSQARKNVKLANIKSGMKKECYFCGYYGNDLCHILPRSLFPQYYTEKWNLIIACRFDHRMFDDNISVRRRFDCLYEQVIQNVRPEDVGLVKKYFGKE